MLAQLTSSLRQNRTVAETIVVHSGLPRPDQIDGIAMTHSDHRLLVSRARNLGALEAKGQFLFFVDDDNILAPGAVDTLVEWLSAHPETVLAGPAMYYASDPKRPFCLGVSHGGLLNRTRYIVNDADPGTACLYSDALPNAFLVRRDQFMAVGGFDEVWFPQHYEESDLAYRLRRTFGGNVACVKGAMIWHNANLDVRMRIQAKEPMRAFMAARNRPLFIRRHLSGATLLTYAVAGQFLFGAIYLVAELRALNRARLPTSRAYISGMVAGWRLVVEDIARHGNHSMPAVPLQRSTPS